MKIRHCKGDLLTSKADVIAHQCNASGGFGSGVARAVRDRFPRVCEQYRKACQAGHMRLGKCQVVHTDPGSPEDRLVANLCGQERYGREPIRYTNYEGIYCALEKLKTYCQENGLASVAFPYRMSSDRGGANWGVIQEMVKAVFGDTDIDIEYWEL